MSRKPKFRPVITRVKLNPEQAVLACECYGTKGYYWYGAKRADGTSVEYCAEAVKPGSGYITQAGVADPCPGGTSTQRTFVMSGTSS